MRSAWQKDTKMRSVSTQLLQIWHIYAKHFLVVGFFVHLRLEAPGASLRQKPVFGLRCITLPIFLLVLILLLILLLFLHRLLLTNSLIQVFPVISFLV